MLILSRDVNPVEWVERKYQQRHVPKLIRRWWIAAPILLVLMMGGIILTLSDIDNPTRDLAICAIWLVQIVTAVRALAAGANAISREHAERTWDSLVMTGISARQILIGKWLGVLHRVAPWMFALGFMRLIMLPVLMLAFVNRVAWWIFNNNTSSGVNSTSTYYTSPYVPTLTWVAWAALLAVVMTVVLTVLDVLCCTALGLAASAVTRRNWLALIAAFCIRFAPVVGFGLFSRAQAGNFAYLGRILRFPTMALADGGSGALYQLMIPFGFRTTQIQMGALPALALATALLMLLLIGSLFSAWAAIRAAGALPQPKPETRSPAIGQPLSPAQAQHFARSTNHDI